MAFTVPLRQATAIRNRRILWRIGGGADTGPRRGVNPALVQRPFLLQQLQQGRRQISNCVVRYGSNNASSNKNTNNNKNAAASGAQPQSQQSSPLGRIGVEAALAASGTGQGEAVRPTIWDEFALKDRVALVSGANRGLGLEMALVLIEAGARVVYCVDLPAQPGSDWAAVSEYVERMVGTGTGTGTGTGSGDAGARGGGRLEYISADVRDQKAMWKIGEEIGNREGRMDVCVAAAGILKDHTDCLEYPGAEFEEVMNVNTNGVLFTAQAAGRQMARFGNRGSIILIASMSGSITNKDHAWVSYNTSKSAVLQMARSMACELGPKGIRVNTLSPGHIYTSMTAAYLDKQPHLYEKWSGLNPLGRLGRPDELRGVIAWLASDASTFCTGSDILVSGGHHAW